MSFSKDWWSDNEKEAIEFLDSMSDDQIRSFMHVGDAACMIMSLIELNFGQQFVEKYSKGKLFDYLAVYEFEQYLEQRLGCKFKEVSKVLLVDLGEKD